MLDVFEKDYIKNVKINEADENTEKGNKPNQTATLVKGFQDDLARLQAAKERTDDPVKKANIDKQMANIKIKMEQKRAQ